MGDDDDIHDAVHSSKLPDTTPPAHHYGEGTFAALDDANLRMGTGLGLIG